MTVTLSSRVSAVSDILAAEAMEDLVLMDVMSGAYYTFGGAGVDIWRMIERPILVRDLCADLATEFDATEEEIQEATLAFLASLVEKRLANVQS